MEPDQVRVPRSTSSSPRPTGSSVSSATYWISRSCNAPVSRFASEEVDLSRFSATRTVRSQRKRAGGRSTTGSPGKPRLRDPLRRRPSPPSHHEPALERVPLDSGRRARRASTGRGQRRRPRGRHRHGPRYSSRKASSDLRRVRLRGRQRHRARAAHCARARGRPRRTDRARSRRPGSGSRFRLVLPIAPGRHPSAPASRQVVSRAAIVRPRRLARPGARWRRSSRSPRPEWRIRSPVPGRARASRGASTPFQPELTRSTSSARSSTRACLSASSSPSSLSSRRIV